jgi:hypothetical protein
MHMRGRVYVLWCPPEPLLGPAFFHCNLDYLALSVTGSVGQLEGKSGRAMGDRGGVRRSCVSMGALVNIKMLQDSHLRGCCSACAEKKNGGFGRALSPILHG